MQVLVSASIAVMLGVGAAAAATPAATQARMQGVKSAASTQRAALPADSVYQLPVRVTDQHGKTWDWTTRRGKPQLVSMFYTSCRYICPLIVDSGKAVDHALTPAQRAGLGVMFISMDARRDTPAALMQVATERNVDPRWSLATPQAGDVRSVAGLLGIKYRELEGGDFNHTSALVLLDSDGRIVARTEKMGTQLDPGFLAAVKALL
jgi:protein SCO1/2